MKLELNHCSTIMVLRCLEIKISCRFIRRVVDSSCTKYRLFFVTVGLDYDKIAVCTQSEIEATSIMINDI